MDSTTVVLSHLLILVISISLIWFISRVLLKKMLKTKWILLTGLVSTFLFYQLLYHFFLPLYIPRTPTIDFNSTVWKSDLEKRSEMIDDLINSKILLDKTTEEVFTQLGPPSHSDTTTYLTYNAGDQYINGTNNYISLDIYIKNNRVTSAEKSAFKDY